jgi:hypothetical protein
MIIKPPEASYKAASASFSEGKSPVKVPDEVKQVFEEKLGTFLYGDGGFQKGSDLKIEYRFIQFNPGSRFARYMLGGIGNTGEGSITVEAKYFDNTGKEVCSVHCEGKIGSGVFGGDFDNAIEKAAKEITDYTKQTFK